MKRIIRFLIFLIFLIIGINITTAYTNPRLIKIRDRNNNITLSSVDKKLIKEKSLNITNTSEAIKCALEITSNKLHFSKYNNVSIGRANCVGYAQYYASVLNYIADLKNLKCTASPVVGYIDINGSNVCYILKQIVPNTYKNFVKDHDFVQICVGTDIIYVDPCIYDLVGNALFSTKI